MSSSRKMFLLLSGVTLTVVGVGLFVFQTPRTESEDRVMRAPRKNRLAHEKSPYLLQHADNPVDWYPWGEEAFAKAKRENKPIFLSIGYSTCHWCHVMEEESFRDPEVAALLNDAFVCIKVDREERPDIDAVFMTVCQMFTGSGGWPLTIVMTPDKKPFFAATYVPKHTRFGRLGLLELVPRIRAMWQKDRQKLLNSAEEISRHLQRLAVTQAESTLDAKTLTLAYENLAQSFDPRFGGFGQKPKFPTPHNLQFLLRTWFRHREPHALEMVTKTLHQMRLGGIYDHVGFGFHRYSTDEQWLVPHFEKMLYDQAMSAMAYLEAYQVTGEDQFRRTAEEIFTYVLRDMTSPEGAFYSAEDADSEGEEGKFYVWTVDEVHQALAPEDAEWAVRVFGLRKEGNFRDEASDRRTGRNILHLTKPLGEYAADLGMDPEALARRWDRVRKRLFEAREKRVHPLRDDKILTDWNGLMIAALAKGAQVLDEPRYAEAARKASRFVLTHLRTRDHRLLHRYRDGEAAIPGYLNDYAFLVWGLIELYQAAFQAEDLQEAVQLTGQAFAHFWDAAGGGFFQTPDDGEKLLVRKKEIYDGAIPSGNSVMMLNLLRLGRMTGRTEWEAKAQAIANTFASSVRQAPHAYTFLLTALDFALSPSQEVVIVGPRRAPQTLAMLKYLRRAFLPNTVVLFKPLNEDNRLLQVVPFLEGMEAVDQQPTAYVCQNFRCELPTTKIDEMLELLGIRTGTAASASPIQ